MAAHTRIMSGGESDQAYSFMKDFMEMVKNPKGIEEAYEQQRKQIQLTEEEVKKAAEARAVIAQADAIKEQQKQEWARLEAAKIEHDGAVKIFGEHVLKDNVRFDEWESRLNEKQKTQAETEIRHVEEQKVLDKRLAEIENAHEEWERNHEADKKAVADAKEKNRIESEKIAEEKNKVKAKAARLIAEAQKDD